MSAKVLYLHYIQVCCYMVHCLGFRQTCLHSTDLQFLQVRGAPNIILTRKECYYWQSHNLCRKNATFACHHKKDGKLLETHDSLHCLRRLCYVSPVLDYKIKQGWFSCAENLFLLVYSHKVSLYLQIWWWNDSVFTEMRKNLVINSLRGPADITNNPPWTSTIQCPQRDGLAYHPLLRLLSSPLTWHMLIVKFK